MMNLDLKKKLDSSSMGSCSPTNTILKFHWQDLDDTKQLCQYNEELIDKIVADQLKTLPEDYNNGGKEPKTEEDMKKEKTLDDLASQFMDKFDFEPCNPTCPGDEYENCIKKQPITLVEGQDSAQQNYFDLDEVKKTHQCKKKGQSKNQKFRLEDDVFGKKVRFPANQLRQGCAYYAAFKALNRESDKPTFCYNELKPEGSKEFKQHIYKEAECQQCKDKEGGCSGKDASGRCKKCEEKEEFGIKMDYLAAAKRGMAAEQARKDAAKKKSGDSKSLPKNFKVSEKKPAPKPKPEEPAPKPKPEDPESCNINQLNDKQSLKHQIRKAMPVAVCNSETKLLAEEISNWNFKTVDEFIEEAKKKFWSGDNQTRCEEGQTHRKSKFCKKHDGENLIFKYIHDADEKVKKQYNNSLHPERKKQFEEKKQKDENELIKDACVTEAVHYALSKTGKCWRQDCKNMKKKVEDMKNKDAKHKHADAIGFCLSPKDEN